MTSPDKALPVLLGLGNPAERLTRSELVHRALQTAMALLDADAVAYHMTPNKKNARLMLHAGSSMPSVVPLDPEGSDALRLLADLGQPLLIADLSADARIKRDGCPGLESGPVMFTPLRQRDSVCGYISTYRRRGRAAYTMSDTRQMVLVAAWLNSALENLRLSTGSKGAVTDDLTEVFNFRFLRTALRREIRRASRFGQELSVTVIGLDRNPSAADQPMDETLFRELAAALAPQVRAFDILARCREDKFIVVMPQTQRAGAIEGAERMRAAIAERAFRHAAAGSITVSMGVASYPQDATDLEDLLAAADRALSQAQKHGGNSVVSIAAPSVGPLASASELPKLRPPVKRA